ncbi:RXLR effector family protein, putative [Phytophthora infestans T30-4]|uniref:RXLR effector family protein, putative n=2 Tax=Phytophthora infestans TaxID=4787 RepID=D0NHX6_PHYIT|nr:RXLR effector family protein, putative [Phytophthora infestans T30-4]EEY58851.1 RXLR effector family protein, putative [Phytophthora infestans T30-4]KAF4130706.1 hypothetical protein GN958_ATG20160 [Phytophthora infestans]|eukprot:XP_002901324.1 RXLR effector family protein, putative [Phytophthora infestans T30-4]
MHFFFLTAVAFIIASLSVDASVARDPRGHVPNRIDIDTLNSSSGTKLLQKNSGGFAGEERAPVIEKLKAFFKSSSVTQDKLQQWLDKGLPADKVFKNMKLDKPNEGTKMRCTI